MASILLPNFELKLEIPNIMLVCKLKMAAIAAIMVAILVAIFNMIAKTHKQFRSAPMPQLQCTKKILPFMPM
jgi:hypothetical protein